VLLAPLAEAALRAAPKKVSPDNVAVNLAAAKAKRFESAKAQFQKATAAAKALTKLKAQELKDGCGGLKSFPNAKPKNYADARKMKYDKEKKKKVPVEFAAGDVIEFKCVDGYSTDGSKDGDKVFDVECQENGFYKPKGVCVPASKCGPLPKIENAQPTGEMDSVKGAQFECLQGYSTDGEKVVLGGEGKNRFFNLKCIEFSGKYEKFEGECKPFGFVPAKEMIRMYNQVFEALFVVTCKGTLKKRFGKSDKPDFAVCEHAPDDAKGDCEGLVDDVKADWKDQTKAREDFEKDSEVEWYEPDPEKPNFEKEANKFCSGLWKILAMPQKD
jgi:hypothetical protein